MIKLKGLITKGIKVAEKVTEIAQETGEATKKHWDENKDKIKTKGKEVLIVSNEYVATTYEAATDAATGVYYDLKFSDRDMTKLQHNIENQGGYYRELNKRGTATDSILLGGESLFALLETGTVSDDIINAYEAAYPQLSERISFEDKILELDDEGLIGFIAGVKGKLFEQKYVQYLNDGNLPDGYTALIAESATQRGWDIAIKGENGEIANVLQAKATDSVSYVKDAIEAYPNIDVVTTDEVYSHLVMSGVSENITNGEISNTELVELLDDAIDKSEITMEFSPPVFALAFIAFTSYKDDSLTLYQKARSAGGRTGKTYMSYLVGGGVAVLTNTWWLGVVGSVSSRILSDNGKRKHKIYERLRSIEASNQIVIERLKSI